jgi:hypothetical protein
MYQQLNRNWQLDAQNGGYLRALRGPASITQCDPFLGLCNDRSPIRSA